jgi:hypothetical protein
MATPPRKTLLEPGHEAEWAELNREKREHHIRAARALTPSERVAQGQRLSQRAVQIRVIANGFVRRPRTLTSWFLMGPNAMPRFFAS